ncbi:MAG: conjugal transfer protein TraL [Syntrophobacteraceae bacterium]
MNKVHLTLQGKGGVGKSYVASLIAQHRMDKGMPVSCIDTDPVNSTFCQYKAFGARQIRLLDGSKVNERYFDDLMEIILDEDSVDFVIDNGASSFIPLSSYLVENRAIETLVSAGKSVVVHSVITGGQALMETLSALDRLATQFSPEADLVVWLNEYFGDIRDEEKEFKEMKVYKENRDRISGVIRIARQSGDTFGKDIEKMLSLKLTFDQAISSDNFRFMAKQRLKMVREALFSQMDAVLGNGQKDLS